MTVSELWPQVESLDNPPYLLGDGVYFDLYRLVEDLVDFAKVVDLEKHIGGVGSRDLYFHRQDRLRVVQFPYSQLLDSVYVFDLQHFVSETVVVKVGVRRLHQDSETVFAYRYSSEHHYHGKQQSYERVQPQQCRHKIDEERDDEHTDTLKEIA